MKTFLAMILLAIGIYHILMNKLEIPSEAPIKALKSRATEKDFSKVLMGKISAYVKKYTKLSERNELEIQKMLDILHIEKTALDFEASRRSTLILFFLFGLVFIGFSPYMTLMSFIVGFMFYNVQKKELQKKLKDYRESIELELPLFTATISQELGLGTRNIELILERYSRMCGNAMKIELQDTLTRIKTSNLERALTSFGNRVSSSKLNDIIRALISVTNGEDQRVYFDTLTNELNKNANIIIRKKQTDKPNQMKMWQLLLFISFALLVAIPLILQIVGGIRTISS